MQYFGFDRPSFGIKTYGFGSNPDAAILALFAGGKQGAWYDPSDKSTLFQDVAGTIPVTKDGDQIGLMKDKSGNGYHATQSVSTARPLYKTNGVLHWFETDGVDDYIQSRFGRVLSQPISINLAVQVNAVSGNWSYVLDSESRTNRIYLVKDRSDAYNLSAGITIKNSSLSLIDNTVASIQCNSSNSNVSINGASYLNGDLGLDGTSGATFGANYAGNDTTKVKYYGIVIVDASTAERNNIVSYLAKKSGVTL